MTLAQPTPLDNEGNYPYPAPTELIVGISLIGYFVADLTDFDLCNEESDNEFTNAVFVLRGGAANERNQPNFSFSAPTSASRVDVAWYKENGRMTTVSRPLTADTVTTVVAHALASLTVDLPERVDDLYVYGHQTPDTTLIRHFLDRARALRSAS